MKYDKELHKEFMRDHKKTILLLDILVVFIILFNFGALFITNVVAVKEVPANVEIEVYEVNPIAAKANDYEVHPESKKIISGMLFSILIWFIILFGYVYLRLTLQSITHLVLLAVIVLFGVSLTGMDFFNNLGYLMGMRWRC